MGLQQEGGMQQYHQRVVYNLQNIGSQGKKIMIVQSLNSASQTCSVLELLKPLLLMLQ